MKTRWSIPAILLLLAVPTAAQTTTVPQYTVSLNPVTFPAGTTVPALHSFARAIGPNGQWLLVTGRTNGLHTFPTSNNGAPPANAFPPQQANKNLWVIDVAAQKVWSAPVPAPPLGDSLTVTNGEFYQDGDTLYVFGGYGNQSSTNQMTTFPTVTLIPVTATINAIMAGKPLPTFQQIGPNNWYDCTINMASNPGSLQTCYNAVTSGNAAQAQPFNSPTGPYYAGVAGGGMEKVGPVFWMVMGQIFQGLYSANPGDMGNFPTKQTYTKQLAALWIGNIGTTLSAAVLNVIQGDPNPSGNPAVLQWNRRDLNVVPALDSNGNPMISVYGGVFVPGQIAAFEQPIHVTNLVTPLNPATTLDPFHQLFSQYECASLKMYSASSGTNQVMFFGGIGSYYISNVNGTLQKDSGLPFVNTLSVLMSRGTAAIGQVYAATPLPGFIGSNATFIPAPGVPRQAGEIVALDKITTKTKVGWMYGGIISPQTQPPQGGTQASNAIYEVWLTPGAPPSGYWNSVTAAQVGVQRAQ